MGGACWSSRQPDSDPGHEQPYRGEEYESLVKDRVGEEGIGLSSVPGEEGIGLSSNLGLAKVWAYIFWSI